MSSLKSGDNEELETELLKTLDSQLKIPDSGLWASERGWKHDDVLVGAIKRLEGHELIHTELIEKKVVQLTEEGKTIAELGSQEVRLFNAIPPEGITKPILEEKLGAEVVKIGYTQAMKQKWLNFDKKSSLLTHKVDKVEDTTREELLAIQKDATTNLEEKIIAALKKRKLISLITSKTFSITKGAKFSLQLKKPAADLTVEMMGSGGWKTAEFKPYNLNALGSTTVGGHLHPLLKVREEYRQIFLQMGFMEMPTNNFVESSFWNFDSLFQPQQHPARDAHDTFFLSNPEKAQYFPEDYLERVKEMHEKGGVGSIGWRYDWKLEEAQKNILRTHTTAVSSRMLYKLAEEGFKPAKYFSIDRVFRNEALDSTHLAEFHQIEGVVADYNLTLGNLMGIIGQFFEELGIKNLKFKPAYNPYTEPSMEIFGFHPGLKKWIELGNSGVFRPEMLIPMGLPPKVTVIAWGLSLERPTMIKYGISNIRSLVGHKVSLDFIKENPLARLDK